MDPFWKGLVGLGLLIAGCTTYDVPPSSRDAAGGTAGKGNSSSGGSGGSGSSGSSGATAGSAGVSGSSSSGSGSGGDAGSAGSSSDGGTAGSSAGSSGSSGDAGEGGGTDECPEDPDKTAPGDCGCGTPEDAACGVMKESLVHRYRFDGATSAIEDSVGDADGIAQNVTLDDSGSLTLAGTTSDQYVDLQNNGMLSALTDATLEAWFTWDGGNAWQRIFDFGSSSMAEGTQGTGQTYLFLSPRVTNATGFMRVAFSTNGSGSETSITLSAAAPTATETHVAVVVDATGNQLALYLDGAVQGTVAFTGDLSTISDVNNWLGRSQYASDPEFAGQLHEFRIYDAPLSAANIAYSAEAGPDPAFLE